MLTIRTSTRSRQWHGTKSKQSIRALSSGDQEKNQNGLKAKIKALQPNEFLESFMRFGAKRNEVFKAGYELFYIARLQDINEIATPPVPPVKALTHTLIFLTKGFLHMKVGSQMVKISAKQCVVISAGQVFSYADQDIEKSEPGEGFMCGFNDDFLLGQIGNRDLLKSFEFLTHWGNPTIKPNEQAANYLVQSFNRILDEYLTNGLQNKLVLQSHLIAALCDLNVDYQARSNPRSKAAVKLANRFIALLHDNLSTSHQVSDYAAMLNISPNHLNKAVKLVTQKSPSAWIKETIINEAKVLLFQSDQTVQEIATQLGMEDPSYFSRLFKKQEGLSPSAYRKMIDLS